MALITQDNRDWTSTHRTSFDKKDLVLGTIVKFDNYTFGMYVPKENYNLIYGDFYTKAIDMFFCYVSFNNMTVNIPLREYNNNLRCIGGYNYVVTRVYYDTIPKKDITKNFITNFNTEIQKFVKDKKYIERD